MNTKRELTGMATESRGRGVQQVESTMRDVGQAFAKKHTAMVVYSAYPSDPRPRRAVGALLEEGMRVDLVCEGERGAPLYERCGALTITRIPIYRSRKGAFGYLWQYSLFTLCSMAILGVRTIVERYNLVYVHNMPDLLVACAVVPKLCGAKVILDQHDPMPELLMTIFGKPEQCLPVRIIKAIERASLGYADHIITVNEACKKLFARRSCASQKISVVMNAPDEKAFPYRPVDSTPCKTDERPFVIMFHGGLVERNGLGVLVEALNHMGREIPNIQLRIYGKPTTYLQRVLFNATESGLGGNIHYYGPRSIEELMSAIDEADVGVVPNPRNAFTDINTPTRIFEYLSRGKPVIAPNTKGITDYFNDASLLLFEPGDVNDLVVQLRYAFSFPREVEKKVRRAQVIYKQHRWKHERQVLIRVISECLGK